MVCAIKAKQDMSKRDSIGPCVKFISDQMSMVDCQKNTKFDRMRRVSLFGRSRCVSPHPTIVTEVDFGMFVPQRAALFIPHSRVQVTNGERAKWVLSKPKHMLSGGCCCIIENQRGVCVSQCSLLSPVCFSLQNPLVPIETTCFHRSVSDSSR